MLNWLKEDESAEAGANAAKDEDMDEDDDEDEEEAAADGAPKADGGWAVVGELMGM